MNDSMPTVAILAGGLATRLRPVTTTIPKSMILVAGEPFIAHQLRLLVRQGVRRVVICCGYLGEQIEEYVDDGAQFGCSVTYSYDGETLRGTGGAIQNALDKLGKSFFILYGDSYLPINYSRVYTAFRSMGNLGLMTIFHNRNQWDASNIVYSDHCILQYDKVNKNPAMEYIDYGLGVMNSAALELFQSSQVFDLSEVYRELLERGQLGGFEVYQRFYEIGTPAGLRETDVFIAGLQS